MGLALIKSKKNSLKKIILKINKKIKLKKIHSLHRNAFVTAHTYIIMYSLPV